MLNNGYFSYYAAGKLFRRKFGRKIPLCAICLMIPLFSIHNGLHYNHIRRTIILHHNCTDDGNKLPHSLIFHISRFLIWYCLIFKFRLKPIFTVIIFLWECFLLSQLVILLTSFKLSFGADSVLFSNNWLLAIFCAKTFPSCSS